MARKSVPLPLSLTLPNHNSTSSKNDPAYHAPSPLSSKTPRTPRSPFRFHSSKMQAAASALQPDSNASFLSNSTDSTDSTNTRTNPRTNTNTITSTSTSTNTRTLSSSQTSPSLSTLQSDPGLGQKQERPARSGFFANYKASKTSNRLQNSHSHSASQVDTRMSRDTKRPAMMGKGGHSKEKSRTETSLDRSLARKPAGGPSRSDVSLELTGDATPSSTNNAGGKKSKPKTFGMLSRSRSLHDDHSPREQLSPTTSKTVEAEKQPTQDIPSRSTPSPADQPDNRSFRSMMSSTVRQRSEDRHPPASRDGSQQKEGSKLKEQGRSQTTKESKDNGRLQPSAQNSYREGSGFLNNLKSSASKGAGALSKGLWGKGGRSGGSYEKDPPADDDQYQLKVLTLPLIEQTRLTRISKKLEDSKDKTEFWMPAFPWRAIDYLNYKGSEVEGLYRVPGSGPQIKKWQRRFDQEFDIDLFEQDELYDINIIGSMLKAWLRELPDELLPKSSQDRINRVCDKDQEEVPQLLIDELSNLSPFNYYLLFAITCHLSLLLAHSHKNKMDYRNLCICFQPCMKIDAVCFKFLVCNWRECWKGCKTEQFYIEQEYMLFDMAANSIAEGRNSTAVESERNISSSDSSKPSSLSIDQVGQKPGSSHIKKLPPSQISGAGGTANPTLTGVKEGTTTPPPQRSSDMRPLSPIKPLSPIGF